MFVAYEHIHRTHSGYLSHEILARFLEDSFLLSLEDLHHTNNSQAPKDYNIAQNDRNLNNIAGDNNDAEVEKLMPTEIVRTTFPGFSWE